MAQGDRGTLGLVSVATPTVTIGGVQNWALSQQMQKIIEAAGGAVDPTFISILEHKPVLDVETRMLTALSSVGIAGAELTTLDAYVQGLAKYGTRSATSTKLTIGTGMLIPMKLTAQQGQAASFTFRAVALSSNGSAAPIAVATGATMPAHPADVVWTIGPVKINGTTYDCEKIDVDFGIQLIVEASGGSVYPTFVSIGERKPKISLSIKDLDGVALGLTGVAQGSTDSVVYFRKMAKGGTRVTDETAEHISLTIDDGMISLDSARQQQAQRGTSEVVIETVYDGSNAIIEIDTTAAIA
jgi:hypothetical protein